LESLKTAVAGLAATHALWALSLLLDGQRYLLKPVIPPLFAIAHLAVALLLTAGHRTHGHLLATPVLTYYTFFIKPFEPIAEPQTVGILGVTAALLVREIGKTPAVLWRHHTTARNSVPARGVGTRCLKKPSPLQSLPLSQPNNFENNPRRSP
jgi:hypothetical protein